MIQKNALRSVSPTAHCLREAASPKKPKTRRKPKPKPPATQEEIAAQVAARIAQLSAKPSVAASQPPSVKVKSIAELRSTKIARLTTKIAVNEAEIARLEREYAAAKQRLDHETEALESRRDAMSTATSSANLLSANVNDPKTKATLALMNDARVQLELVADRAQDLLQKFKSGELGERATMRELKNLLEGAKDGGCDVAGLCQMVSSLDFTGGAGVQASAPPAKEKAQRKETKAVQAEVKTGKTTRKRKVQEVKAENQVHQGNTGNEGVITPVDSVVDLTESAPDVD